MQSEVAVVRVTCCNQMLFLNRKKGALGWGIPGGHINKGESSLECAKRELFEETGLIYNENCFQYVKTELSSTGLLADVYDLKVKIDRPITLSTGEHSDYIWLSKLDYHHPLLDKKIKFAGNSKSWVQDHPLFRSIN